MKYLLTYFLGRHNRLISSLKDMIFLIYFIYALAEEIYYKFLKFVIFINFYDFKIKQENIYYMRISSCQNIFNKYNMKNEYFK